MRVLVTGCAGFIGFHLCERLLREGHEVVGVDNFLSGQRQNAADLQKAANFRFVEHDISAPLRIEPRFDLVCNLACPASPLDFDRKPLEIMAVCSRGLWNMLDLARAAGARLLQTSTSEVYGDPAVHPQREDYWGNVNSVGPRSCYDEGKRFGEALIVSYRAVHRIEARIARIFNTYGPRMRADDGRALPNFITQALTGRPITVHGDGSQTRSLCYVDDQVDGLLRLALSNVEEPVNIGNPQEITMRDLAQEIVQLCGSRSTLTFTQRPVNDPERRCPDITRARELLGWTPQVDRAEGLRRTVDWFREQLARGDA